MKYSLNEINSPNRPVTGPGLAALLRPDIFADLGLAQKNLL